MTLYILVINLGGVNHDAKIFWTEAAAKKAFRRITGESWADKLNDQDKYSESRIFKAVLPFPDQGNPRKKN